MPKMLFFSYARADLASARRLVADLRAQNLSIWFDQDSLIPGQRWRDEIEKAIRASDYFLALLSSNSVNRRGYVQAELAMAVSVLAEVPYEQIFLIPVRLDDCRVTHPRLRDLHWVDLFPNWDAGVAQILRAVLGASSGHPINHPESSAVPAAAVYVRPKQISVPIIEIIENLHIIGQVFGIAGDRVRDYNVLVYVKTDKWYIHPYERGGEGLSFASINPDGSWQIETVKRRFLADLVAVLVVDRNYAAPPQVDDLRQIRSVASYSEE